MSTDCALAILPQGHYDKNIGAGSKGLRGS